MSQREWDLEFDAIAQEIERITSKHAEQQLAGLKALTAKRIAIIQSQITWERSVERIKKLLQQDFMLLPKEKALAHWVARYVVAQHKYSIAKSKLTTKAFWVKLIGVRMAGTDAQSFDPMSQDDLVALSVRQANLSQTEVYLNEALLTLRKQQEILKHRYQALSVVEANHVARGSLATRLGANPEDALQSPLVRSLENYVRLVTSQTALPAGGRRLQGVARRTARRVNGLMGLCRSIAISRIFNPKTATPAATLDRFSSALDQLDDLEAETREAYSQIMGSEPPSAQPILMQNSNGQAKTSPTN